MDGLERGIPGFVAGGAPACGAHPLAGSRRNRSIPLHRHGADQLRRAHRRGFQGKGAVGVGRQFAVGSSADSVGIPFGQSSSDQV